MLGNEESTNMRKITHILAITLLMVNLQLFVSEKAFAVKDKTVLDCLVKPEMYIEISSPVAGVLDSVLVKKADTVSKGQVLAKLDASVELAKVEVAQQEALMNNQVYAKGIKLSYARRKVKRIAGLFKENASSAQEQDDATTELAIAKTELKQIKLDKKKNVLKLFLAKAELQQKTITSPINGIVVERYLMPGESVQNQPVLKLAKIDPLLVEVVASANLFGQIKAGMMVEVKPDFPANSSYKATVSTVDRIIDAASGSFTIRLALPNPDEKLVGGTKCIAIFPIKTYKKNHLHYNNSADDELPEDIKALLRD
ncbi:MAG: efflux RND transporter periplasmic adaptor subunit [Methylococcales bacterium]|nr:efflux RND transporter periplasmic adaptor subunit [Methylococcales bacterium]